MSRHHPPRSACTISIFVSHFPAAPRSPACQRDIVLARHLTGATSTRRIAQAHAFAVALLHCLDHLTRQPDTACASPALPSRAHFPPCLLAQQLTASTPRSSAPHLSARRPAPNAEAPLATFPTSTAHNSADDRRAPATCFGLALNLSASSTPLPRTIRLEIGSGQAMAPFAPIHCEVEALVLLKGPFQELTGFLELEERGIALVLGSAQLRLEVLELVNGDIEETLSSLLDIKHGFVELGALIALILGLGPLRIIIRTCQ
ncbi:hypothetical protein K438DRAFT_1986480 [Mycena galopus ATCC 62051]|nr:hypothetical protein K438DRAFT_1986480 [Mycena galopus ATCC 62051]